MALGLREANTGAGYLTLDRLDTNPNINYARFGPPTTLPPELTGPSSSTVTAVGPTTLPLPSSGLGQLPPIPRFTGDDQAEGETFNDWHEQFESVATLAHWDKHCRLVNLTTRLRGSAYSYRSCPPDQRSSYDSLVVALQKRFTPVQLTAVQTQLFHERRQGPRVGG